ncbi:hypothetical protein [Thermomonospora umbrina]|uniref:Uncharacterized protein n=1 Tax=Thermomonospora umbrina TaxID=111806 RepID=A0A3D9SWY6_9ACTN|nr:hypothetical protein [Thermomonospora umbrina]REF00349.1 hypothetical protein DFJ69_5881 [Thermomonospora umbrina]
MNAALRILHSLASRHTWRLDVPAGTSTAVLVCLCGKTERVTVPDGTTRCFCRDVGCDGWRAYIAHFTDTYGRLPSDNDIDLDDALHAAYEDLLEQVAAAGPPPKIRDIFARLWDREVPR